MGLLHVRGHEACATTIIHDLGRKVSVGTEQANNTTGFIFVVWLLGVQKIYKHDCYVSTHFG